MFYPNCSSIHSADLVGPREVIKGPQQIGRLLQNLMQVYESLGFWSIAVYVILFMHVVPVWVFGTILLFR